MGYPKLTPIVASGATEPRYIGDRAADTLNFYDFGAVGDGVADDTAAVQAALNAGKPLTVRGVFKVSSVTIPQNSIICGDVKFIEEGSLESGVFATVGQGSSIDSIKIELLEDGEAYLRCVVVASNSNIKRIDVFCPAQRNSQAVELLGNNIDVGHINVRNINRGIVCGASKDIDLTTGLTPDGQSHYKNILVGSYCVDSCLQGIKFGRASRCSIGFGVVNGLPESIEYTPRPGLNGMLIEASDNLQIGDIKIDLALEHAIRIGGDSYMDENMLHGYSSHDITFGNIYTRRHGGSAFKINPGHLKRAYNICVNNIISEDSGMRSRANTRRLSALRISYCSGFDCNSVVSRYTDSTLEPTQEELYETDVVELVGAINVDIANLSADVCGRSLLCLHEGNDDAEAPYADQSIRNIDIHTITCKNSFSNNTFYLMHVINPNIVANDIKLQSVYIYGTNFGGYIHNETASNISNVFITAYDRHGLDTGLVGKTYVSGHSFAVSSGGNLINSKKQFDISNGLATANLKIYTSVNTQSAGYGAAIVSPRKNSSGRGGAGIAVYQEDQSNANCGLAFLISGSQTSSSAMVDVWRMTRSAHLYPSTDNYSTIGMSGKRVKEIFCATSTINTSDARLKTGFATPEEDLMRAWGKVRFKVFQFKDAVAEKGESARMHVGIIAQELEEAFASEGLDASRYGLFCYDEWPEKQEPRVVIDKPAVLDSEGNVLEEELAHTEMVTIPAGNRYSIRYEEALALECAYQRWRLEQLEERVNQLTSDNG